MQQYLSRWFPQIKDKNIFLYYIYSAFYGLYPINAIVALFFLFKGLDYAQIGIVFTVFSLAAFVFEVPTGVLADKYGRRNSILVGLTLLTLTALSWTVASNYIHFAILAGFWMLGFTCISGSLEAYIYDHLETNNAISSYDGVLAKGSMLFSYFGAIGAIIGTFLYAINHYYPYYLLGLTFFLSAVSVWFMDNDITRKHQLADSKIKIWEGLKAIFVSSQLIWVTSFIAFFFGYYHFFINSVNTPYLLSLNLFDVRYLGAFWALIGIVQGTVSNKFDFFRKRFSDAQIVIILSIVQVGSLLTMGYFAGFIGLIAFCLFVQIEPFETILLNSFSQKFVEKRIRATTISSIRFASAIVASSTGYFVGRLVDSVGINQSFIIVATFISFVMVILIGAKKKMAISL